MTLKKIDAIKWLNCFGKLFVVIGVILKMFKIRLENTNDAEEFVKAASKCGGDVDLHSGVVYIDGKSLLGVLAMGIKRELNVSLNNQEDSVLMNAVQKFVVA